MLLQANERMERRVEWLEHKFLEAQAQLLEAGQLWLFHLKAQYMLFRLSPAGRSPPRDSQLLSFPHVMLLPSSSLESLITFFRAESRSTPAVGKLVVPA